MKFTKRTALGLTTISAILLTVGLGVWRQIEYVGESVENSYRLVSAGELFLEYKKNTGNWPHNWDSLRQYAAVNGTELFACEDFDDLKNNIHIDFSLDLKRVDTTNAWSNINPQIQIFVSKTGQTQGATFNPNELIYSELQRDSEKMRTKR